MEFFRRVTFVASLAFNNIRTTMPQGKKRTPPSRMKNRKTHGKRLRVYSDLKKAFLENRLEEFLQTNRIHQRVAQALEGCKKRWIFEKATEQYKDAFLNNSLDESNIPEDVKANLDDYKVKWIEEEVAKKQTKIQKGGIIALPVDMLLKDLPQEEQLLILRMTEKLDDQSLKDEQPVQNQPQPMVLDNDTNLEQKLGQGLTNKQTNVQNGKVIEFPIEVLLKDVHQQEPQPMVLNSNLPQQSEKHIPIPTDKTKQKFVLPTAVEKPNEQTTFSRNLRARAPQNEKKPKSHTKPLRKQTSKRQKKHPQPLVSPEILAYIEQLERNQKSPSDLKYKSNKKQKEPPIKPIEEVYLRPSTILLDDFIKREPSHSDENPENLNLDTGSHEHPQNNLPSLQVYPECSLSQAPKIDLEEPQVQQILDRAPKIELEETQSQDNLQLSNTGPSVAWEETNGVQSPLQAQPVFFLVPAVRTQEINDPTWPTTSQVEEMLNAIERHVCRYDDGGTVKGLISSLRKYVRLKNGIL